MSSNISPKLTSLGPFSFDPQEKGNKENSFEVQKSHSRTSLSLQTAYKKSPRPLDSLPTTLISHILLMAAEPPSNIAPVSRHFNIGQNKTYSKLLSIFAADPRLRFCTQGLSHKSILKMSDDEHRNRFKKIHEVVVRGAKETGIISFSRRKKPAALMLDELSESAGKIQRIRDEDLITFHRFLTTYLIQNKIAKKIQLPNCLGIENEAAWIRKWMHNAKHTRLLLQVEEVDLENKGLRTVPPEVGLCEKVERLYLANNQITVVRIDILNPKRLKILDLDNNRVRWINKIGRLTNLLDLSLSYNKLKNNPWIK